MSSGRKDQERDASAQDELIARYQQASALDEARPSPLVRAAVLAHARSVAAAAQAESKPLASRQREASNSPRWRIQALGSLAVVALTGLVFMQFDRGSDEEREVAFGTGSKPVATPATVVAPAADVAAAANPAPAFVPEPPPVAAPAPVAARSPAAPAPGPGPAIAPAQANAQAPATALPPSPAPAPTPAPTPAPAPLPATTQAPATALAPQPIPAHAPLLAKPAAAERSAAQTQTPVRDAEPSIAEAVKASAVPRQESLASADASPSPPPAAAPGQLAARPRAPAPVGRAAAEASGSSALASRRMAANADTSNQNLHQAALTDDVARIEALLAQGANLESVDQAGRTPLLLAVIQGQRGAVARLLAAGANAQAKDREGTSALRHAQSRGFAEIEALLRQHGAR